MIICKKSKINGQFTFNEYVIFFSNILLYSSLFAVFSLNITFFRLLSYCILLSLFYESVWCSLMIYPALFFRDKYSYTHISLHNMFHIFLIIQSSKAFYKSLRFNTRRFKALLSEKFSLCMVISCTCFLQGILPYKLFFSSTLHQ